MKTIALFGGSFDPPHIGHKAIVEALQSFKDIDKIVIMPTFLNPFKSSSHAPAQLRLKWLKDMFKSFNNIMVSDYEVTQKRKVPSISSVKHLLKTYKKVYLVIGADNLSSLNRWKSFNELNKLVTFIIITRDDIKIDSKYKSLNVNIDISSTKLREHMDLSMLSEECAVEISKFYKEKNENND